MKTTRPAMPIERAIDRACGSAERTEVPITVRLRCFACGNLRSMAASVDFPDGTSEIRVTCANCGDGSGDDMAFFDVAGEQIG